MKFYTILWNLILAYLRGTTVTTVGQSQVRSLQFFKPNLKFSV